MAIVTIKKPHVHQGELLSPGDKIDVDKQRADWLAKRGVIAAPRRRPAAKPAAEETLDVPASTPPAEK